ncbi:MAG: cysteine hydrolase, partial [Gammaproteobacteria bacterium]|nr:cysteine hydrolase [Gammaproteobacteria bacterium]
MIDRQYSAHRTAVLFIDFQIDVCAKGGKMVSQEADILTKFAQTRQYTAELQERLRGELDKPLLVHIQHVYEPGYPELSNACLTNMERYVSGQGAFIDGTEGAQIVPELQPKNSELLLKKNTLSPFASTKLHWILRKRGIDTVVIAGVVTHYA